METDDPRLDQIRRLKERMDEEYARRIAREAVQIKGVAMTISQAVAFQFQIGLLPVVLGLFDAAVVLAKILLTDAEKREGESAVRGTREMLKEKLVAMEQILDHQAKHASDARTASTN